MDFQQIRKYVKGVLTNSFLNKTTLDKLSTSDAGNLLFDGKEISGSESSKVVYGGIDVNNVIYELTSSVEGAEWVATEDCYFIGSLVGGNDNASTYYIDGVVVGSQYSSSTIISCYFPILLLKGQTIKCKAMDSSYIRTVKFYGVKKSENILHEYSTEEKVVGKWIDGKPIYEKTFSSITITNNTDNFVSDNFGDKALRHFQIDFNGISNNLTSSNNYSDTLFINTSNQLMYYISRTGSWWNGLNTANITVQYTKTTD